MLFTKYLKFSVFIIPLILLLIIGFNRLIDPYTLYGGPTIEGINANKPAFSSHLRLSKAAAIQQQKPHAIVLGTSRGEYGIDPEHPGWKESPVYNLSLSSANLYEAFRYLQHAQAIQPLQQAVLMLDFFMFNAVKNLNQADFTEERLAASFEGKPQKNYLTDKLAALASLDAITASIETVIRQHKIGDSIYFANGMLEPTHNALNISKSGGHHKAFLSNEKGYFNGTYDQFSFKTKQRDNWRIYRRLLLLAQQQGIDLTIVISPSHARQFETIAAKGIWETFEQWKRQLVVLNESVAAEQGKRPFALWDFSGYNHYTTEAVPPLGDTKAQMQWYWESSHYKKELGDLVLDRMFNYKHPDRIIDKDFGVQLTSKNIETHLQKIRNDRQQWREIHPNDVTEIQALKK